MLRLRDARTRELTDVLPAGRRQLRILVYAPGPFGTGQLRAYLTADLLRRAAEISQLLPLVSDFLPAEAADAVVAAFRDRMAPGSYLVISAGHGTERNIPVQDQIQAAYGSETVLTGRTASEFATYFGDFELMPPGIVPVTEWPLDPADPPQSPPLRLVPPPTAAGMLAGIGRKRT